MKHFISKKDPDNLYSHIYLSDNIKKLSQSQINSLLNAKGITREELFSKVNSILFENNRSTKDVALVKQTNSLPNINLSTTKIDNAYKIKSLSSHDLDAYNPNNPVEYEPFTMNSKGKVTYKYASSDGYENEYLNKYFVLNSRGIGSTSTSGTGK